MQKKFLGFGFGAIQGGLFLYEAFQSGNFDELTVAEVMPAVVRDLREAGGVYRVNVAGRSGIVRHEVRGVAVWNSRVEADRAKLVAAVAEADEIATALPSVDFYGEDAPDSVVSILAEGLRLRSGAASRPDCVIYTAENNNHAAEILWERLERRLGDAAAWAAEHVQCLNTVIGKMSGVVTDAAQIRDQELAPLTPNSGRCLLVEEFNRILITRITLPGFRRGIEVFEEKPDLLPFEEAKLYGHNATHAMLGYLARLRGLPFMADVSAETDLVELARAAFIEESGGALCRRHAGVDDLFTPAGYTAYAEDLLERMLNPHLRDAVARVVRDPQRKLGWDDRLVGVMRAALAENINPARYALGAAAALRMLAEEDPEAASGLPEQWRKAGAEQAEMDRIMRLIYKADASLPR